MTYKKLWEYTLQPEDSGRKYQEILLRRFHFSRTLLQRLKSGEYVWVNGKFTFLNARGKEGEILTIDVGYEEDTTITGEDKAIDILYEDDYLLVVNKPPGLVIHPTPRYPSGTLGNAVVGYWLKKGEPRPFRPITRIDRNTSGVVVIGKNSFTHHQLAWQSEKGYITKRYLGLTQGLVPQTEGLINASIGLAPNSFILRQIDPLGSPARTRFKVLKYYQDTTLLEFFLETGRTHQIRVHCQHLGHPLLGDDLYGGPLSRINRQALHATSYTFLHPYTNVKMTITAPFPPDLRILLKALKSYDS